MQTKTKITSRRKNARRPLDKDDGRSTILAFRSAWNGAASVEEAARITGLAYNSAKTRACFLRSKGIDLKTFPKGRKPTDYAAMVNSLSLGGTA